MPRTTPSSATHPASAIDRKIALFKAEVAGRHLTDEQQRIYNVFIRTKGAKSQLKAIDKNGREIRFTIDTTKTTEGTQHVLTKHYKGSIGRVTASEILNMLEVIRHGDRQTTPTHIVYRLTKQYNGTTYTMALKIARENLWFKSFYSDRRQ